MQLKEVKFINFSHQYPHLKFQPPAFNWSSTRCNQMVPSSSPTAIDLPSERQHRAVMNFPYYPRESASIGNEVEIAMQR
jgi:hypothetical protein